MTILNRIDQNTILEVNLKSLCFNYNKIVKTTTPNCITAATVKANAYGLGIREVSKALIKQRCNNFFVATLEEGIELRNVSKNIKIYILNGLDKNKTHQYRINNLTPVLNSIEQIKEYEKYQLSNKIRLNAILNFDTGMSRLGMDEDETKTLVKNKNNIIKCSKILYIMSHLACGDDQKNKKNKEQLLYFTKIAHHFPKVKKTLANSAGIMLGKKYHFDMVRPGISIYGGDSQLKGKNSFKQVVTLRSRLIQIRKIRKGATIGYGATFKAKKNMIIGTIAIGYADGINRLFSNNHKLYLKNKSVNLVGRVSMDLITVDLTSIPKKDLNTDNKIEIINKKNTINKICKSIKTIPYEILTSLGNRYLRIYKNS